MASRSKKKPRKRKPAGQPTRFQNIFDMVLAGIISGLIQLGIEFLIEKLSQ